MKRLSVKGIVLGAVSDLGLTALFAIPIFAVATTQSGALDLPQAQQNAAIFAAMRDNPSLYVAGLVAGSLASFIGGYVAARVAKRAAVLNGAASAVLCVALGLVSTPSTPDTIGPWQHLAFVILSPALGALGGLTYQRRLQRPQSVSAEPPAGISR